MRSRSRAATPPSESALKYTDVELDELDALQRPGCDCEQCRPDEETGGDDPPPYWGFVRDKVRENRLRRMAHRQGLKLWRSRRRDTRAIDYGPYNLLLSLALACCVSLAEMSQFFIVVS